MHGTILQRRRWELALSDASTNRWHRDAERRRNFIDAEPGGQFGVLWNVAHCRDSETCDGRPKKVFNAKRSACSRPRTARAPVGPVSTSKRIITKNRVG